jgi:hypothetical protein
MARIKIDLGSCAFELSFTVKDFYMTTPLGCHAGGLGSFAGHIEYKTAQGAIGMPSEVEIYKSKGVYRKIMDALVTNAAEGFGDIGSYPKKGHWILSAPWGKTDHSPGIISTAEVMDLIAQFCDREPEKYGRYVMTDPSDCAAHGNNSGFPATRTMVWMPAYVGFSQNHQGRSTRTTGVWTPYVPEPEVPKAVEPAKVVDEQLYQEPVIMPPPQDGDVLNVATIKKARDVLNGRKLYFDYEMYRGLNRQFEQEFKGHKVQVQNLPRNEIAKRRDEQTRKVDRMYPGRYQGRIDIQALRRRHGGGWEQRYGNKAV